MLPKKINAEDISQLESLFSKIKPNIDENKKHEQPDHRSLTEKNALELVAAKQIENEHEKQKLSHKQTSLKHVFGIVWFWLVFVAFTLTVASFQSHPLASSVLNTLIASTAATGLLSIILKSIFENKK